MNLKEFRLKHNLTIKEASEYCGVPLRTYIRYENDDNYGNKLKRDVISKSLIKLVKEKDNMSIEYISNVVSQVCNKYQDQVSFCYLFGSYAKGYATEKSDVDLCVSTKLKGLNFIALKEELMEKLDKDVDLIRSDQLTNNFILFEEIMKDGIRIYKKEK